jgi:ubiquinone/menaquinone biosynthesis C-methylase UbiE
VRQFHQPRGLGGRAVGWFMAHRGSNRERSRWAVTLLDIQPEDRVLEVGFGPGVAIEELARRATRGQVCGIDHSDVMVRQATRRNAAAVREGRVDLRLASFEDLPAFDAPFDKILAVNSLQFAKDPVDGLRHLRVLLRPGGTIAVVLQPRCPGATAETSATAGQEILQRLSEAGFGDARVETLPLNPPAVGVLAINLGLPVPR